MSKKASQFDVWVEQQCYLLTSGSQQTRRKLRKKPLLIIKLFCLVFRNLFLKYLNLLSNRILTSIQIPDRQLKNKRMALKTKINRTPQETSSIFAIAKAVSHNLYVNKKIDINHGDIMTSVDLEMGSIDQDNRMNYNGQTIYVQDDGNKFIEGDEEVPDKSWWKVELEIFKMT